MPKNKPHNTEISRLHPSKNILQHKEHTDKTVTLCTQNIYIPYSSCVPQKRKNIYACPPDTGDAEINNARKGAVGSRWRTVFAHLGGWQCCTQRVASEHKLETRAPALKRWGRALQKQGTASGRLEVARQKSVKVST